MRSLVKIGENEGRHPLNSSSSEKRKEAFLAFLKDASEGSLDKETRDLIVFFCKREENKEIIRSLLEAGKIKRNGIVPFVYRTPARKDSVSRRPVGAAP